MLLTPQDRDCGGNCSDWEVQLRARYAWSKAGGVNATRPTGTDPDSGILTFTPAGLPPFSIYSTAVAVAGAVPGSLVRPSFCACVYTCAGACTVASPICWCLKGRIPA